MSKEQGKTKDTPSLNFALRYLLFVFFHVIFTFMTITQTVEIPADHKVFFEFLAPTEIPAGKAKVEMKLTPVVEKMTEAQELEIINRNAERLNREALDVLSYQNLDI